MSRLKLKLRKIDPVKAGIVYGAILALLSLVIILPLMLFASALAGSESGMPSFFGGGIAFLFVPIIYGIVGFIGGLIGTLILNFVLSKTDGLEVEFDGNDVELSQIGKEI